MTEYDYSPEAVERYKDKQRSVHRWAVETSRHNPANPITLSKTPQRSHTYSGGTHRRSSSSSRPSSSARPQPRRSSTDNSRSGHRSPPRQPTRSYTTPPVIPVQPYQSYAYQPQPYFPPPPPGRRVVVATSPVQQSAPAYYYYTPQPQKKGVLSRLMTFMGVNTNPKPVRDNSTHSSSRHSSRRKRRYSY
ncbi:hypothetical protein BDZ89DRAFT_1156371 [Hymenopellis radicata]|nr:hypothetical protein BDZ89DRAFT_1156371 [Hymenopellis radicata]